MGKYPYKPSLALLLVSFLGLATQICSAKQHHTSTSFRHPIPERLMQNTYDIVCNQALCKSKEVLSEPETTYRLILSGNSKANLEFDYDETKQLLINFELGDLSEPVNVTVEVWTSQDQPGIQAACNEHHVPISITESNKNKFVVTVLNPYVNSVTVPVKISFIAKPEGQQIPKWIIPVSIVGGAIMLLGIIVSISCLKYSENRRLRNRYIQHSASNQSPYDIDVRYPETKLEELKSDFSQTSCAICLEDLQASQLCRQFDCQHIFHTQCAKMWLESQILKSSKAACPICNQQVMSVDPNQ